MGNALQRPWVEAGGIIYFERKPVVEGSILWDSRLEVTTGSSETTIIGNGLPDHPTGQYPIARDSAAYQYDRNPNSIGEGSVNYILPATPAVANVATCLPRGPIAVTLSGAVLFNALDADDRDAVANEVFDSCEGHPERQGTYHYHHGSPCFATGEESGHSPLIGYALDGFGIYRPRGKGGKPATNEQLDECHGHLGPAGNIASGSVTVYHYHLNNEFPYTLGCFRGAVDDSVTRQGPPSGAGPTGGLPPPDGGGLPRGCPPPPGAPPPPGCPPPPRR